MTTTSSHVPTYPVHTTDILALGFPPRLTLFDHDGEMSIRPSTFWFLLTTFAMLVGVYGLYLIVQKFRPHDSMPLVGFGLTAAALAFMFNLGPFYSAVAISPILKLDAKTRRLSWHAGARSILMDDVESFEVFTGVFEHRFETSGSNRSQPNVSRYVQWRIRAITGERQVIWHSHMRSKHNAGILEEFALAAAIPIELYKADIFEDESNPIGQRVSFLEHSR